MNVVRTNLNRKMIRRVIWLALTIFVLLVHVLQSATGTTYYSAIKQNYAVLGSPPVILQAGTAGSSTIYANCTSAKVSARVYIYNASSTYNHVLKITENHVTDWKIRLRAYDQSNMGRLNNCSIYIYDGSNSTQVAILNGAYTQQTGPWYDLAASDIEYIWMLVEASSAGTSYVYVYLEILVPNITTYAQYTLTFVIT